MKTVLALILAIASTAFGQQPQTQDQPIFNVNAKFANGTAPGYWITKGTGLVVNISGGTAFCGAAIIQYAGGTLTMTATATNYVYLNTASSCAPAVKTTALTVTDIPIAQVVTSGGAVTAITDLRTMMFQGGTTNASDPTKLPLAGGTMTGPIVLAADPVTASQAANKNYVDNHTGPDPTKLPLAGGTMTGPIVLAADPTTPSQAANKNYVDSHALSDPTKLPLAGGILTGPVTAPNVNGKNMPTGAATLQNTIDAAAALTPDGSVEIPAAYAGTDSFLQPGTGTTNPSGIFVEDKRPLPPKTARSVMEWGAKCDAVTDDWRAIQDALDYANMNFVALTLPASTCKISKPLDYLCQSIYGMGSMVSVIKGAPGQDVLNGVDGQDRKYLTRVNSCSAGGVNPVLSGFRLEVDASVDTTLLTNTLAASMLNSDSTLTLTNSANLYRSTGYVKVGRETMHYTGITTTGSGAPDSLIINPNFDNNGMGWGYDLSTLTVPPVYDTVNVTGGAAQSFYTNATTTRLIQSVAVITGHTYTLTFSVKSTGTTLSGGALGAGVFIVSGGTFSAPTGTNIITATSGANNGVLLSTAIAQNWTTATATFTANTTGSVRFYVTGNFNGTANPGVYFDGISMVDTASGTTTLTGLDRGTYGVAASAHAAGEPIAYLGDLFFFGSGSAWALNPFTTYAQHTPTTLVYSQSGQYFGKQTTIVLNSAAGWPVGGGVGQIGRTFFTYTGVSGNTLTGVSGGKFGTADLNYATQTPVIYSSYYPVAIRDNAPAGSTTFTAAVAPTAEWPASGSIIVNGTDLMSFTRSGSVFTVSATANAYKNGTIIALAEALSSTATSMTITDTPFPTPVGYADFTGFGEPIGCFNIDYGIAAVEYFCYTGGTPALIPTGTQLTPYMITYSGLMRGQNLSTAQTHSLLSQVQSVNPFTFVTPTQNGTKNGPIPAWNISNAGLGTHFSNGYPVGTVGAASALQMVQLNDIWVLGVNQNGTNGNNSCSFCFQHWMYQYSATHYRARGTNHGWLMAMPALNAIKIKDVGGNSPFNTMYGGAIETQNTFLSLSGPTTLVSLNTESGGNRTPFGESRAPSNTLAVDELGRGTDTALIMYDTNGEQNLGPTLTNAQAFYPVGHYMENIAGSDISINGGFTPNPFYLDMSESYFSGFLSSYGGMTLTGKGNTVLLKGAADARLTNLGTGNIISGASTAYSHRQGSQTGPAIAQLGNVAPSAFLKGLTNGNWYNSDQDLIVVASDWLNDLNRGYPVGTTLVQDATAPLGVGSVLHVPGGTIISGSVGDSGYAWTQRMGAGKGVFYISLKSDFGSVTQQWAGDNYGTSAVTCNLNATTWTVCTLPYDASGGISNNLTLTGQATSTNVGYTLGPIVISPKWGSLSVTSMTVDSLSIVGALTAASVTATGRISAINGSVFMGNNNSDQGSLQWGNTGAPADAKWWQWYVDSAGTWTARSLNDAFAGGIQNLFSITRTGSAPGPFAFQIPVTSTANFTGGNGGFAGGTIGGTAGSWSIANSAAGTDLKTWQQYVDGSGTMHGRAASDSLGSANDWFSITRTGFTPGPFALSVPLTSSGNLSGGNAGFIGGVLGSTTGSWSINNSGAGADLKTWQQYTDTAGTMHGRAASDSLGSANDWLTVTRTGFVPTLITFGAPLTASKLTASTNGVTGILVADIPAAQHIKSSGAIGAALTAKAAYVTCTAACTITLPTPVVGGQYCARNLPGVSSVITFAGIAGVSFELFNHSGWGAAANVPTSGGATGDQVCWIGYDATHYELFSYNGTWTD
jgi:hypothetical protein